MTKQAPMEEMLERIAEGLPGLKLAGAAVGLRDHAAGLHDHREMIRRDYERGNKMFGGDPVKMSDEMGDIVITGDIQVGNEQAMKELLAELRKTKTPIPLQPSPTLTQPSSPLQPQPQQPQEPTQQQPAAKSTWQKLWPWLLAAAVPAAGAGGVVAANYWSKPTAVQDSDTWFEWDSKATPSSGVEDNEQ